MTNARQAPIAHEGQAPAACLATRSTRGDAAPTAGACVQADAVQRQHIASGGKVVAKRRHITTLREDVENLLIGAGVDPRDADLLAVEIEKLSKQFRPPFMRIRDIARRWSCSQKTVRRRVYQMKLKPVAEAEYGSGRALLFRATDVDAAERRGLRPSLSK